MPPWSDPRGRFHWLVAVVPAPTFSILWSQCPYDFLEVSHFVRLQWQASDNSAITNGRNEAIDNDNLGTGFTSLTFAMNMDQVVFVCVEHDDQTELLLLLWHDCRKPVRTPPPGDGRVLCGGNVAIRARQHKATMDPYQGGRAIAESIATALRCFREKHMTTVAIDLFAEVFSALNRPLLEFGRLPRMAAIQWRVRDEVSMENTALIAVV